MLQEEFDAWLSACGAKKPGTPAIANEQQLRDLDQRLIAAREEDMERWEKAKRQSVAETHSTVLD